eukprot:scaffold5328_cov51-Phaeocystis_antarctica.AAC.3
MQLLVDNFNPATIPETMCRSLVSVSWDGKLHACTVKVPPPWQCPTRASSGHAWQLWLAWRSQGRDPPRPSYWHY